LSEEDANPLLPVAEVISLLTTGGVVTVKTLTTAPLFLAVVPVLRLALVAEVDTF